MTPWYEQWNQRGFTCPPPPPPPPPQSQWDQIISFSWDIWEKWDKISKANPPPLFYTNEPPLSKNPGSAPDHTKFIVSLKVVEPISIQRANQWITFSQTWISSWPKTGKLRRGPINIRPITDISTYIEYYIVSCMAFSHLDLDLCL